ncbi:Gfo/Idh/MocA family oxidoreductase [Agriterribacter sp.]|uniref:Gfo/Idh/MocA family protein n=1 Tax=Agriterribacter sp. TaxID=2821509 RepID=UPI002C61BCEB|nr:Gfo/Idh/MocA family oxidoreductase [Agriterribacter sp.]HRO45896.1 Gfo/Idh/MocA family oxidoreductase [Agriterribacter sp.]HRO97497.1 Gfo/Idh/MocA family oxidoreductase [Ferruginibacter sp.]
MKNRKIKWGVIGSGGIAYRKTIPEGIVKAPNAILSTVYDVNEIVNNNVAKEFSALSAKSIEDVVDSDVDAVYIASPPNVHLEHVIACAKKKKHILCEKPLGLTTPEIEQMIKVCEAEGVALGVGLMMRFSMQHREALKAIEQGIIGKPVFGRAQLSCWYPPINGAWRQNLSQSGGGSLMDMGSHCIDLLEMFFGAISSVSCRINNVVHNYGVEDSAVVLLEFANGATAIVDTHFCVPDAASKNMLELYGSQGSIIAKGTIGQSESGEMTIYSESDERGYDANQVRASTGGREINPEPVNTYLAEIQEFGSAILENRKPLNDAAVGLRNHEVVTACYQSAKTGGKIII